MPQCAGPHLIAYLGRQPECTAIRHRGDADIRRQKQVRLAQNPLREFGRGAADANHRRLDRDQIVHARWLQEFDLHRAHDESKYRARFSRMNCRLMDAERAQKLGPAALEKAQIRA